MWANMRCTGLRRLHCSCSRPAPLAPAPPGSPLGCGSPGGEGAGARSTGCRERCIPRRKGPALQTSSWMQDVSPPLTAPRPAARERRPPGRGNRSWISWMIRSAKSGSCAVRSAEEPCHTEREYYQKDIVNTQLQRIHCGHNTSNGVHGIANGWPVLVMLTLPIHLSSHFICSFYRAGYAHSSDTCSYAVKQQRAPAQTRVGNPTGTRGEWLD